jgi:membrane protein YqaA with SNARE-associated domain
MLSFSYSRYSTAALFVFSFAEASFFPLPPDILQIPMTLERPKRAWYYAGVSTVASVLGGIAGYGVGYLFIGVARWLFSESGLERVREYFDNFWLLAAGSIVVHPYKLFTIAAGVFHVSLVSFTIASVIGRGLRFFLVAGLLWKFGEPVRHIIDRYFNILSVLLGIAIVGTIVIAKML